MNVRVYVPGIAMPVEWNNVGDYKWTSETTHSFLTSRGKRITVHAGQAIVVVERT